LREKLSAEKNLELQQMREKFEKEIENLKRAAMNDK
jgi:hypothetical protein